jgi:hypothetical protein
MYYNKSKRVSFASGVLVGAISLMGVLFGTSSARAGAVPIGYSCTGNCGTDGADGVVTLSPLGSSVYDYISTNGGLTGAGELSGYGGTNGSSLQTPIFTASAGAALNFYFNFVTSDGGGTYADYAFAQLINATNQTVVATLFTARTEPSGSTSPGQGLPADQATLNPSSVPITGGAPAWSPLGGSSGTCFAAGCGYTGWINSNYSITNAGSYYLNFGVTNIGDTGYNSGLAIDGVTVAGVSVGTPAPEPASLALFMTGLIGLFVMRRRMQQQN